MSDYSDFNAQGNDVFAENPFAEVPFEAVPFEEKPPVQEVPAQLVQPTAVQPVETVPAEPVVTENQATVAAAAAVSTEGQDDEAAKKQNAEAEEDAWKKEEHEAAEAKRKADFDARQAEKKKNYQLQLLKMQNLSDEEVMNAAMLRAGEDTEKLTRMNMKECVCEYIQTLCLSDAAFARLTMHPRKSMIRCFQYINRKALEYIQDELKAMGHPNGRGLDVYCADIPNDLCYQWAEDYFRDPTVKEDEEQEEKFVPRPYISKTGAKTTVKKPAEKKKQAEKKPVEKKPPEPKKADDEGQLTFGQMALAI